MSPILVPTLSELAVELAKAIDIDDAILARWHALQHAGADAAALEAESHASYIVVSELTDQIAALPIASIADLRVKAMAMDWYNRTIEPPADFWTQLGAQIVAGLLDQRVV